MCTPLLPILLFRWSVPLLEKEELSWAIKTGRWNIYFPLNVITLILLEVQVDTTELVAYI